MLQTLHEELRSEANRLLDSGLRRILNDYGDVHLAGSYDLGLMVWRDLDIHIVQPAFDTGTFFELGRRIAELLKPHRMHYRDETLAATPGLPRGLYWGVYLGDERHSAWKIDIWVTDAATFEATRAYGERIKQQLNEATRPVILELKAACWRHPEYRRRFTSSDIYTAVLDHGVASVEDFWTFLAERNRSI
jgi:hypothetical protein